MRLRFFKYRRSLRQLLRWKLNGGSHLLWVDCSRQPSTLHGHSVHEWLLTKLPLEMRPNPNAAAVDAVVTTLDRLTMAVVILCITLFVPNHSFARRRTLRQFAAQGMVLTVCIKNGLCCAFADGVGVQDVDWNSQEGNYRVTNVTGNGFGARRGSCNRTQPFRPCRRVAL